MTTQLSRREAVASLAMGTLVSFNRNLFASSAAAPDIPTASSWATFRHGPTQRGIAGTQLSADPQLKWEVTSQDGWVATCAIVGNHVYAPALQGYLYCFDRESGEELWKYRSIESRDEDKFAPGFKAAPTVTADAVYVGDEDGVLHAVDRTQGTLLWKFATDAEIAGGVAVFEDKLLLASHDSFLYCLSKQGEEIWKFQTNDRINCSPGIADHFTFLSGCDQHLRVIDVKTGTEVRDLPLESIMIASPALFDDMLYVGTYGGDVVAVNWRSGEMVWRYTGERPLPYHASAAVTDDLVVVGGHDRNLHAIDRRSGELKWTFATKARIESSAAVVDDRVFFGSGDRNIYGLSLKDGSQVWKFNAGKTINAGIAIGEGCLVVGEDDHNGRLRCFA
jgi:outer membrane protein assembly factor BamB